MREKQRQKNISVKQSQAKNKIVQTTVFSQTSDQVASLQVSFSELKNMLQSQ